ncbi:autotransporter domain-containing protein [Chryseolinea sp. H1M3-3]|uniref:autotransporter domain-containing protein n=1 Tax=Chryseolinea sp. H1M3-3 TaxID=3034144 RepID=UPI0023ECA1F3|nr:autotransporter domain-containing protein [Chryseolinea sp. H1M3-3]
MLRTVVNSALFSLLLLLSLKTQAQFTEGDKFIRGNFSFNNQKNSEDSNIAGSNYRSSSFEVMPAVGFFLNNKVAIGGAISYTSYYQKNADNSFKNTTQNYSLGFFVNRYFVISERFYFMLGGNVSYSRGRQKTESQFSGGDEVKYHGINISIKPTFIFFPDPKWGIEAGIGYLNYAYTKNLSRDGKYNSFNLNYGTFSLGFAYYFTRASE